MGILVVSFALTLINAIGEEIIFSTLSIISFLFFIFFMGYGIETFNKSDF